MLPSGRGAAGGLAEVWAATQNTVHLPAHVRPRLLRLQPTAAWANFEQGAWLHKLEGVLQDGLALVCRGALDDKRRHLSAIRILDMGCTVGGARVDGGGGFPS